jgi:hypothetical protein
MLDCYLAGWAEGNVAKILAATAPNYQFRDPLVGGFSRKSLYQYFDHLRERLSRLETIRGSDIVFLLYGPMDLPPSGSDEVQFWREAPRIGLTGVSRIEVGPHGVAVETVAYDLNLAADLLRCVVR